VPHGGPVDGDGLDRTNGAVPCPSNFLPIRCVAGRILTLPRHDLDGMVLGRWGPCPALLDRSSMHWERTSGQETDPSRRRLSPRPLRCRAFPRRGRQPARIAIRSSDHPRPCVTARHRRGDPRRAPRLRRRARRVGRVRQGRGRELVGAHRSPVGSAAARPGIGDPFLRRRRARTDACRRGNDGPRSRRSPRIALQDPERRARALLV